MKFIFFFYEIIQSHHLNSNEEDAVEDDPFYDADLEIIQAFEKATTAGLLSDTDDGNEDDSDAVLVISPNNENSDNNNNNEDRVDVKEEEVIRDIVSAHFLLHRNQLSSALSQYQKLGKMFPNNIFLLLRIVTLQLNSADYAGAEATFEKVRLLDS